MTTIETKLKKLTRALSDSEENRRKSDKRLSDLQNQVQKLSKSEAFYKSRTETLESNARTRDEKIAQLEKQVERHQSEKTEWLSTVAEADQKITDLDFLAKEKNFEVARMKLLVQEGEEKSEKHRLECERTQTEKEYLEGILVRLEEDVSRKDGLINELQQSVKNNLEVLYTENEFDVIVDKLKATRSENRNLKLENLRYLEEIDRLKTETEYLERLGRDEQIEKKYAIALVQVEDLQQDKMALEQEIENQAEYRKMYEDAQRELMIIRFRLSPQSKISVNAAVENERDLNDEKFLYLENINNFQ